jgi:hypothetical protein
MELSTQLNATTALSQRKEPPVSITEEASWASETVWTFLEERKPLTPGGIEPQTPYVLLLPMAQQPLVGQGLLNVEASRSHFRHTTLGRTPLDE